MFQSSKKLIFIYGSSPVVSVVFLAIRQIRKAIEWDSNSPPFHHNLAILLSTTCDIEGTIKALAKAIELDPDEPEYLYKVALAYSEAGNMHKAVSALEKTMRIDPRYGRS